jgi:hypothetical protein
MIYLQAHSTLSAHDNEDVAAHVTRFEEQRLDSNVTCSPVPHDDRLDRSMQMVAISPSADHS